MTKQKFTQEEIEIIRQNPYVCCQCLSHKNILLADIQKICHSAGSKGIQVT